MEIRLQEHEMEQKPELDALVGPYGTIPGFICAFCGTKLCGTVKVFRRKIVLVKDQPDMLINIVAAGHVFHRPIKEVYRVVAFTRDIQMDAIPVLGINRLFDFLEILRFGFWSPLRSGRLKTDVPRTS